MTRERPLWVRRLIRIAILIAVGLGGLGIWLAILNAFCTRGRCP